MHISQLIAAQAVQQVLTGKNLTVSLPVAMTAYPQATVQQRGGAADFSYGTLRYYYELRFYLKQLIKKPLTEKRIEALLLVALYQLQYDQAQAFTVVNQAVKAVSKLKNPKAKPWAKGLVNGVCRAFLRQKADLNQQAEQVLSTRYSYPNWWVNQLKHQYPDHWESILQTGNQHPPMTLRVSAQKATAEEYVKLLAQQDIAARFINNEAVMLEKPVPVEQLPGFGDGVASVQDYGAQLAAHLLDVASGMRVLDACSAPGGKAAHALSLADIQLTALDNDATRLEKVQDNLNRLSLSATVTCGDAAKRDWWDGQEYDRILADVPCSASGIVRRHVDMKCLRRHDDVARFSETQAKILANLWQMLRKGGKLLYATCSIFDEENQRQIDQFLSQRQDAKQLPLSQLSSSQFPQLQCRQTQLLPNPEHDGFYYALLQKV